MISEEELIASGLCFKSQKDSTGNTKPIHAPINLTPTPFSSKAFLRAQNLQPAFNLLVLRTIQNSSLVREVCGKLAESDDFVAKLFEIYIKYPKLPKLFFSINRSDYMVEGDEIFQIELNTISASLAGLSTKLANFFTSRLQIDSIPNNNALKVIGSAFDRALQAYQVEYSVKQQCAILFIVQEDERNVYDQNHLRNSINPAIPILTKSLKDPEIFNVSEIDGSLTVDEKEIGIVYYRAGYSPNEYVTLEYWKSRDILESSRAIKCPDIGSHLAGLKKIQQVLTSKDLLLETMRNDAQITQEIFSTFAGIYSLDDTEEGMRNTQMACADPERFVLKPQREGGGNNFYGPEIRSTLQSMSSLERSTFILMDRIRPIVNSSLIFRDGKRIDAQTISELGIYGVILVRIGTDDSIIFNEEAGWLLRTKPVESDEGGVVSGYSVLDVPKLQAV